MKFAAYLLAIFFIVLPTQAETIPQTSLFFTPQETRTAESLAEKNAPAGSADIKLGAVMYYGPNDWTLWLQGERWTPETAHDDIQVLEVTADHVRLSWHGDEDRPPRELVLLPNQTFQIATGQIIASP